MGCGRSSIASRISLPLILELGYQGLHFGDLLALALDKLIGKLANAWVCDLRTSQSARENTTTRPIMPMLAPRLVYMCNMNPRMMTAMVAPSQGPYRRGFH